MKKLIVFAIFALSAVYLNAQSKDTSYFAWGKSIGTTVIIDNATMSYSDTAYITPFVQHDGEFSYPIFINKNGVCFIYKVDSKTNKPYKSILPAEASRYIRARMSTEIFSKNNIEASTVRQNAQRGNR